MKSVHNRRKRPSEFLDHLTFFLIRYLLLNSMQGLMSNVYTEIKVFFVSKMSSLNGV